MAETSVDLPPPGTPDTPSARILGHGGAAGRKSYCLLITPGGKGFSRSGDYALTEWAGDRVEDADGFFCHLRDLDTGAFWAIGDAPSAGESHPVESADASGARWQPGRFEIRQTRDGIEACLDICVPPGKPLEIRRVRLINRSGRARQLELTSLADVVLNDPAAHASHPAYSKLFIQTSCDPALRTLLVRRRPRANDERQPCLFHALTGAEPLEVETDRARFYSRGTARRRPDALTRREPLSGTTGNVLDPIVSLRLTLDLAAGAEATRTFLLGMADTPEHARQLVAGLTTESAVAEAFEGAERDSRADLNERALAPAEAEALQELAGALLYGHPGLRPPAEVLARAAGSMADLGRIGVATRRALAVLHAEEAAGAGQVSRFLAAGDYWRSLGLPIDTVLLVADETELARHAASAGANRFVLNARRLDPEDLDRLDTVARLVIRGRWPEPACGQPAQPPRATAPPSPGSTPAAVAIADGGAELHAFNGYGGFSEDGREYVIRIGPAGGGGLRLPPRPWVNVMANESFGCLVSETGAGATWNGNSREHRLTPWYNDALLDPHGEAFYIRDEESGAYWSPLPGPTPGAGAYETRHGLGYSVFRHIGEGLEQETRLFVARHDPLRATTLTLTNRGDRPRRLSLFASYRLVLGGTPGEAGRCVTTEPVPGRPGALLARNLMADEFSGNVAFAALVTEAPGATLRVSGDRAAFLGRDGQPGAPAALAAGRHLDGRTGAGLDAAFLQEISVDLPVGATLRVSFLLGEGADTAGAGELLARYADPAAIASADEEVCRFWREGVDGMRVETPIKALDWMVNAWLPYQTLSCRIWGRSAFYQSGGAFGFRDQLQDAASLVFLWPELAREQLLRNAAHQFEEGDVLHWWHPPLGRGLRTRFADDLVWLPFLLCHYLETTGDDAILEEVAGFVSARLLAPGEDEEYLLSTPSGTSADLYEHCCRALDRSLTEGAHGLPLFGTGDWNDGMNRVGREGRGESVWMGFFLYDTLGRFLPLCERRKDGERAARYGAYREKLRVAVNEGGWDGGWYRRGYYDDGTPLGSAGNDECRIDALAQAWAVLSGAAPPARAAMAMDAADRELISEKDRLIRLLTPPFENTPHDPGYIKGYVPGVRENGGQYTHAALWVVRAMAELGRNNRAAPLLEMLSPVSHSMTPAQVATYQVEPFVVAADVYGAPPHVGRGGWTWYTGSAGWMYRVALESVLGFTLVEGRTIRLRPCVPDDWPGYRLEYRVPGTETRYDIVVSNPHARAGRVVAATLDGAPAALVAGGAEFPLARDGRRHRIELTLGSLEPGAQEESNA